MSHVKKTTIRHFRSDEWMTTGDVSVACRSAPRTVAKWADTGIIPAARLPGSKDRRFQAKDVIDFMRRHSYVIPFELGGYYTYHVLLVSPDRQLASQLNTLPCNGELAGYRVLVAESGWVAAEIFMLGNIDVVVVDWADRQLAGQVIQGIKPGKRPWLIELLPEDDVNHPPSPMTRLSIQMPACAWSVIDAVRKTCEGDSYDVR
jgi:hypothetical protein